MSTIHCLLPWMRKSLLQSIVSLVRKVANANNIGCKRSRSKLGKKTVECLQL